MITALVAALTAVVGLVVALLFQKQKTQSAEALNTNIETKQELLKKDQVIAVNNASLVVEEQKRTEIQEEMSKPDVKETADDLVRFLNNNIDKSNGSS